jgi:sigma-B regulation protein RsbU (phosphoserine phosphatase)
VILVADVSGKGVAASLLTASLGAFSAASIEEGLPADEICARVSQMLFSRTPPNKYATAFLGILSPETGTLRYVNAGHNPPLVIRGDEGLSRLAPTGPPLGLLADATYKVAEASLLPGDILVIYTDGITEAVNSRDEEFSSERLEKICRCYRTLDLPFLAEAIEREVDVFTGGLPAADDRTLVLLRRLTSP